MSVLPFFLGQLLWFTVAWGVIHRFVVWPWAQRLPEHERLSLFVAPQMFRVLGVGLLVGNLSPGMPSDFAIATAIGDSLTALLSLLAFVLLRLNRGPGRLLAWAATLIGTADLLIAFPHAAHSGALEHLAAQWYVPVFAGPVMINAHIATWLTLLRRRPATA